ncbi:Acg family FMN-binding oxidoreductase [Nocardioides mesophilus]|uniref:NAD(P)H nitroreductase n=1 Tax=Nocardioides mesophilus TaxID=433659 RepID=A0A7G9R8F2_9ACTN|nr:NAD(P)H nitroreductase [Nocardioides mesophilus]QNN51877.1 NAD(P)H nitroreductase [Nocardioides mesophilus]
MTGTSASARATTAAPPYEELLTLACRAPSVHNTQPWLWRATATGLELVADRSRQLLHSDPDGRDLAISCGAALHHVQVAAAGLGWASHVRRVPEPGRPHRLAMVSFTRAPVSPDATRLLQALAARHTDRRPLGSWPVPPEQLHSLARSGSRWGAHVLPVSDGAVRQRLAELTARADELQRSDTAYLDELALWRRNDRGSGMPTADLLRREPAPPEAMEEEGVGLLMVATSSDDTLSRLRAGEALSEVWLRATQKGLSVVPMSQCIEVAQTRAEVSGTVLEDRLCPQILVRIGWLPASREPLERTPRRALRDVFLRT